MLLRLLLTLVPGLAMVAGAIAFYYKTDFLFSIAAWRLSNTGKYYVPAAVLLLAAIFLTLLAFWFKRKRPEVGNRVFTLYIFLPFIAYIVFSEYTSTLMIAIVLGVTVGISQVRVFRLLTGNVEEKMKLPGVSGLSGFQAILLALIGIAGILLFIVARDWAYGTRKLADVQAKGIYSEIRDVATLIDMPRIEYAKITDPDLQFGYTKTKKFGSGENSYRVTYATLVNTREKARGATEWPLWYYCGSGACSLTKPLYVAIDRCDDATECPNDFLTVLRDINEEKFRARYRPLPGGLRLLSEAEDLGYTEDVWRAKMLWRLILLAILQLSYTGVHGALSVKLRGIV